jgi:hypothetical protein
MTGTFVMPRRNMPDLTQQQSLTDAVWPRENSVMANVSATIRTIFDRILKLTQDGSQPLSQVFQQRKPTTYSTTWYTMVHFQNCVSEG